MLERELFSVLESTADAAFVVDEHGLTRSWNRAAERLFGLRAAEVLERPCAELIQGQSPLGTAVCTQHCSVIECAIKHREVPNYDMEVRGRGGRKVWVNVSILVFRDDRAGRTLVVHLARDIADRKRKEAQAQRFAELAKEILSQTEEVRLPPASPLTEKESLVLRSLAQGKDPSSIARELGMSPRTLRNHTHRINQKLRTRNRLEAVMQATRRGLI